MTRFYRAVVFLGPLVACGPRATTQPPPSQPSTLEHPPSSGTGALVDAGPALVWDDSESPIPVTSADPSWGLREAPVTLVAFADLSSPYNATSQSTLDQLRRDYGRAKLRIVWKSFPVQDSVRSRHLAEAALGVFGAGGNDAFWKCLDSLGAESHVGFELDPERLADAVQRCGNTVADAVQAGLKEKRWASNVERDVALAKALGVRVRPTLFINGIRIDGVQPAYVLKQTIDDELGRAQAAVAAGTPPTRVYIERSRANHGATLPSWDDSDSPLPVSANDPTTGWRDALVTVVEFGDFAYRDTEGVESAVKALRYRFGADKVRFVWKDNPNPQSPLGGSVAEAARGVFELAGSEGFWQFHDKALEHLRTAESGLVPGVTSFAGWAADVGVDDAEAFRSRLAGRAWLDKVTRGVEQAKTLSVREAPSFFINGLFVARTDLVEYGADVVAREIKKAEARTSSGIPRDRIYVTMSRDNGSIFEVPADGPATFGPERAPLTVVGYCSLEDRSCAILLPKLQWLGEKYPSKVRVVWKSAASCAGAGSDALTELAFEVRRSKSKTAFWQALTELAKEHAHAGAVSTPGEHDLRRLAAAVGISPERARLVIQDRPYVQSIDVDADSSLDLQAICAPHVFINGKHLVSVDSAALMAAVDVELQKTLQKTAMTKGGVEFYRPVERPLPAGLPPNDPSRGNADAPVVVHEFCTYDYACAGADAMLVRVMHDFGDRVRVVWHDVAAPKMLAAMAAREAYAQKGAVAFFSVHDRILGGTLAPTRADLDRFAQDLHLDMNLWKAALDDGSRDAELAADWNAVSDGPMRTTPAWLVTHRGAQSGYSLDASATRPELRWAIRTVLRTHAK